MSTSFFQFYSLTQLFLLFSTPVLTGLGMRRRALNRDCSSYMKRVKWKELMKRVTFFFLRMCWIIDNCCPVFTTSMKMVKLKPGFHMIATIAVIAAIAERNKFNDRSDNDRWDRKSSHLSLSLWSLQLLRSLESGFRMIAMITAIAEFFFPRQWQRSQRS